MSNPKEPAAPANAVLAARLNPVEGIPVMNGVLVVGQLHCDELGLSNVNVLLDATRMVVMLSAPCGCYVTQSLVPAIKSLADTQGGHQTVTH